MLDRSAGGASLPGLAARGALGGVLMGLANLVPGISGGTMLLAAGVYPWFIRAIAEVTTFRFRRPSLVVLGSVGGAAAIAIVLLAGVVRDFVVSQRWMAFSLFIGLTLGGVPVVWRLIRNRSARVLAAAGVGFAAMASVAWVQGAGGAAGGASEAGLGMMLLAGVIGASAMILPGISGGYLLLVMGVYVPILSAVSAVKDGLKAGDLEALGDPLLHVVIPVGIGVVLGVVLVSNALKWLLANHEQGTLGALLGLLLGAVVGLWPFQQGVAPEVGTQWKGQIVSAERLADIKAEDYPTSYFEPTLLQVLGALGFVGLGFAATLGVARFGREDEDAGGAS